MLRVRDVMQSAYIPVPDLRRVGDCVSAGNTGPGKVHSAGFPSFGAKLKPYECDPCGE